MTEELIKQIKNIQQQLINAELSPSENIEKMEAVRKLEEVNSYLKDALGNGIEF